MLYTENTGFGSVGFGAHVLGYIVKHAFEGMNGRFRASDPKGRTPRGAAKPNSDDLSFLKAEINDGMVDLTVYAVIRFGAGIKVSAAALTDAIRAEVPLVTGLNVNRMTVVITGILSKNISRRNIEVTTYAE